jgi:hypothetical protein
VGRSLLYPPDGDVARAVDAAAGILAAAADSTGVGSPGVGATGDGVMGGER